MTNEIDSKNVIWVPIENVIPNPMNPRTVTFVQQDDMIEIIRTRGWGEPLTAYQQGENYVLLAGHRKLSAAHAAKEKRIPLFVVDKPENIDSL